MNNGHINHLGAAIQEQADVLFPNRNDQSMFLKMYSELGELASANTPAERAGELADVLIMILDYGSRHGIDMELAILRKMAINQNRKWVTNALGVNQHVE